MSHVTSPDSSESPPAEARPKVVSSFPKMPRPIDLDRARALGKRRMRRARHPVPATVHRSRSGSPGARRAWARAGQGLALALGAPLGWLVIQAISGSSPSAELSARPLLYAYMLAGTGIAFSIFGFSVGLYEDRLVMANLLLDELAVTDPTTGIRNARYFFARLAEEMANLARNRQPLSVLAIDLDFFKAINDSFGHLVGDQVLAATAAAIASVVRQGETAARVGGEEFAILLPRTDAQTAANVAERVRAAVEETRVAVGETTIRVTASIGVAGTESVPAVLPEDLYRAADRALYEAKAWGRNQVVVAEGNAARAAKR